jgi:hypothetical protein
MQVMRAGLIVLSFAAQSGNALADGPPKLNVSPSCVAAVREGAILGRTESACMSDENSALDVIKKNWSMYSRANKDLCIGMVTTGGAPSYVELVSCLEIMRDAGMIHETLAGPIGIPANQSSPSAESATTANQASPGPESSTANAQSTEGGVSPATPENVRKRKNGRPERASGSSGSVAYKLPDFAKGSAGAPLPNHFRNCEGPAPLWCPH